MFSEDSGSEAVRLAVMKTLTKMAGEAGTEITTGTYTVHSDLCK